MTGCFTALLVALGLTGMPLLLGLHGFILAAFSWVLLVTGVWLRRRVSRRLVSARQDDAWLFGVLFLTILAMTVTLFLPLIVFGF